MKHSLYTIGYAQKSFATLLAHLRRYGVTALADVRSTPYSRVFPDYNREAFAGALREEGIAYVYLGEELGPRSRDPSHYRNNGQVDFLKLSDSEGFQGGVGRLSRGVEQGHIIAVMCAEIDPATCHRSLLVGHALHRAGWGVDHITSQGDLESQAALEARIMQMWGIDGSSLFEDANDRYMAAWEKQCGKCAWRDPAMAARNRTPAL